MSKEQKNEVQKSASEQKEKYTIERRKHAEKLSESGKGREGKTN